MKSTLKNKNVPEWGRQMNAERTGLEPATSYVTGRRSNQLNYHSIEQLALRPLIYCTRSESERKRANNFPSTL